jgi:hypothetical protein
MDFHSKNENINKPSGLKIVYVYWKAFRKILMMKSVCNICVFGMTFIRYTQSQKRGRRSRDRMVVGFTTTYAIIAYHH